MKAKNWMILAVAALGSACAAAEPAPGRPVADDAGNTEGETTDPVQVERKAGRPAGRHAPRKTTGRGDSVLYRTMLLRILDEPEARKKIGLSDTDYQTLVDAFASIDEAIALKREALGPLQEEQARLFADQAPEAAVMAAVDAVWRTRAEIAKLQTAKLLKVRGVLGEEQIRRLDDVRREIYRARRRRQLRAESPDASDRDARGLNAGKRARPVRKPPAGHD